MMMLYAKLRPVAYARRIGVRLGKDVMIYGSSYDMFSAEPYLVTIGDNVHITQARFVCHDGGVLPFRKWYPKLEAAGRINIGSNTFIGLGACILHGVTIGENCIIGAYAVVTRDIPAGSVVGGNPARVIKSTEEYISVRREKSLEIGDLHGFEKMRAYKKLFHVED
jgi:acetyltransferase-like isoleucine patch superfamily enzyme